MSFKLAGLIFDTELPPTQTLLMLALADYSDECGTSWPSKETLAKRSRVSKRTVDKYIDELASADQDGGPWLFIEKFSGRKSNRYTINVEKLLHANQLQPCRTCTPEVQPMLHPRGATHAAPELPYNNHRNTADKKSPARTEAKKATAHSWFVAWWCYTFQQLIGSKYAMTAKDGKQVKQLLQQLQPGDLLLRACSYFDLPEQKRFPRGSPTIGGLMAQINEVANTEDETIERFQLAGLLPAEDEKLSSFKPWKG